MKKKIPPFNSMILYEDEDYIVINKPPFLSSLEDRNEEINVLKLARMYHDNAQLCHRLDKDTSGALIISKHPDAYKFMTQAFEKRSVTKTYRAVSDGLHHFSDLELEKALNTSLKGASHIDERYGKRSVTIFNSIRAYKKHTLINCNPITGRMHQIRVHLAYLKAPITGDITYGGKPFFLSTVKRNYKIGKFAEEQPLIQRLALHAYHLKFPLFNGDYEEVTAPYPKDFRVLLQQLEKNT
jgi:23S rRNA pseudouridine955/2504/2580 synthase